MSPKWTPSMLKTLFAAAAASALLSTAVFADDHGQSHVAVADAKWEDAPLPGVQFALAWGEDATGATWLFKIDPGVALPMHTHSSDYRGLSISGTWVHIAADGTEVATGPGDHSLIRGGAVHADRCDGAAPCIFLLDFAGLRDVALAR